MNDRFEKLVNIDFEELVSICKVKKITLDRSNWTQSRCTCSFFLKNYFCYHVIVVAVNEKLTDIPLQFKKIPIAPKSKVGRKSIAKRALIRQD